MTHFLIQFNFEFSEIKINYLTFFIYFPLIKLFHVTDHLFPSQIHDHSLFNCIYTHTCMYYVCICMYMRACSTKYINRNWSVHVLLVFYIRFQVCSLDVRYPIWDLLLGECSLSYSWHSLVVQNSTLRPHDYVSHFPGTILLISFLVRTGIQSHIDKTS